MVLAKRSMRLPIIKPQSDSELSRAFEIQASSRSAAVRQIIIDEGVNSLNQSGARKRPFGSHLERG
jgi:hypothetical protein